MEKIKVLMIDDNVNLVNMVKEYFSSHSIIDIVLEAYNGEEGINTIQNNLDRKSVV